MHVRCNWCMKEFHESDILYDEETETEFCPFCGESGNLMNFPDENENDEK